MIFKSSYLLSDAATNIERRSIIIFSTIFVVKHCCYVWVIYIAMNTIIEGRTYKEINDRKKLYK